MPGLVYTSFIRVGRYQDLAPGSYYRKLIYEDGRAFMAAVICCPGCGRTCVVSGGKHRINIDGEIDKGATVGCPHCPEEWSVRLLRWDS